MQDIAFSDIAQGFIQSGLGYLKTHERNFLNRQSNPIQIFRKQSVRPYAQIPSHC